MGLFNSKRFIVFIILLLILTLVLVGCSQSMESTTENDTPSVDNENSSNSSTTSEESKGASQWKQYIEAAKHEGRVTVVGANSPEFRQKATEIMEEKYGITLDYLTLSSSEAIARVKREVPAGKLTIDVQVSGGSEMVEYPDWLEPLEDKIVMPEVAEKSNWMMNELLWADENKTNLQITQYVAQPLWINTNIIPKGSITAADLLKPEYKGKIAVYDPQGPGQGRYIAMNFLDTLGESFVKDLYTNQDVIFSDNGRQLAEWLANGTYPIAIALLARDVEPFISQGLPIAPAEAEDAPGYVNGKLVKILKDAPHPNAAVVFVNWLASKEGMELFSKSFNDVSLRTDVSREGLPEYSFPKEDIDYPNFVKELYVKEEIPRAQELLSSILDR